MFANLFRFLRTQKPARRRPARKPFRPSLEVLEARWVPTLFTVTNNFDSGLGSLRQAILDSNGDSGPNRIDFSIGSGVQTISPSSALPVITKPVTIAGDNQPGFVDHPLIELDGTNAGPGANGLTISAGDSTVKSLVINRFTNNGIDLTTSASNHIVGNYIGTDVTGTVKQGNLGDGITVGGPNNTIGGTTAADRNIISGNFASVLIAFSSATGNLVEGNYMGTDVTGTQALGNLTGPEIVQQASNNTIGGTTAGARNVISGNTRYGIDIFDSGTTGNLVQGNYIGTNAAGTAALPNGDRGVIIQNSAADNIIGGTSAGAGNLISGNTGRGVDIFGTGTTGNQVLGNHIGTTWDGTGALSNSDDGVAIDFGATANTIGGTAAGAGNLISGNMNNGVEIFGDGAANNQVLGNDIGTDVTGTSALGNHSNGVAIGGTGANNNTVGGIAAGAGNLIAGNGTTGIVISSGSSGNLVQGNLVGTDVSGARALANTWWGVVIASFGTGTSNNTVGGTTAAARNVISGNGFSGMFLWDVSGNAVQGNYIGTDVSGARALANGGDGVTVSGNNNMIGGTASGAGNVIAGNSGSGVSISSGSTGSTANLVQGNLIGTDATGTQALANHGDGVAVSGTGTTNNTIGGTATGARDVIAGNAGNGVHISSGSSGNQVLGNDIGTDVTGTLALPNAANGVILETQAAGNTVGGTIDAARNVISGNGRCGVLLGGAASGNAIQGNYIGTDKTGTIALGNGFGGSGYVAVAVLETGTVNNLISGNLISGNPYNALRITAGPSNTLVQGNFIGTDVTGTLALGNGYAGSTSAAVLIDSGAINTTVGGTVPGAGNLISGNVVNGLRIAFSGTTGTVVQGNFIGTDVSGTQALPNMGHGVLISPGASGNLIGGTIPGAGNTIAFNANDGVLVDTATGNAIQQNSIHDSGNLGIELVNGGNNNQAFPVLTSATSDGVSTTITGTLNGAPTTTFTLEFFANIAPNPSGYGEGQQYLGSSTVTTDDSGNATFTATFTGNTTGQWIAATATDPANNTSSFSQDVMVNAPDSPSHPRLDLGPAALAGRAQTGPDPLLAAQSAPASPDPEAQAGPILPREVVDQVFGGGRVEDGLEAFAFYRRAMLPGTDSDTALSFSGL